MTSPPMFPTWAVANASPAISGDGPAGSWGLSPMTTALSAIDFALFAVGVTAAVAMLMTFAARRQDPLRDAPPRKSRFREESIALAMGVYLFSALVLAAAVAATPLDSSGILASLVIGGGAQIAGAAACLALASRQYEGGVRRILIGPRTSWWRLLALAGVLAVIGIAISPAVSALTVAIIEQLAPGFEVPLHPTLFALEQQPPAALVVALWAGAMVVAPLAEELFFRGLMQTALLGLFGSRWAAITLSALAFGLVHYQQPHAVAALFVLGFIIGYGYERTGSLATPVLVHVAFNAKTLVWEALR